MDWLHLGTINPSETTWEQTNQEATASQNLVCLTYISTGLITSIKSRLLIRRLWIVDGELPIEEQASIVYPSPNRILLNLPVLANYVEFGLATYKIQVKKYYPFRKAIITEPAYSLKVEVG